MKFSPKYFIFGLFTAGVALFGFSHLAGATASTDDVTICHATSSTTNPYEQKSPDKSADVGGHNGHNGGVYFAGVNSWGDIIPPFTYYYCADSGYHLDGTTCKKGGSPDKPATLGNYAGKNWGQEGQAVWNNSCKIPAVDCDGDYDTANPDGDDSACVSPSPSVSPSPTTDPCLDANADPDDCPVTPTVTPTATPTATPTQAPNNPPAPGDGLSDGRSSCPECTQPPHTSVQAVLGASTMAGTGTFADTIMNFMLAAGIVVLALGAVSYAKEKKS